MMKQQSKHPLVPILFLTFLYLCLSCGYDRSGNMCCVDNCEICQEQSMSRCSSCKDGYNITEDSGQCNNSFAIFIAISATLVGLFIIIPLIIYCYQLRRNRNPPPIIQPIPQSTEIINNASPKLTTWEKIQNKFGQVCSICLEPAYSLIQCGHIFHPNCFLEWQKKHKQCPLCQAIIRSNEITIFCQRCNQFGLKKNIAEVAVMQPSELRYCDNCAKRDIL